MAGSSCADGGSGRSASCAPREDGERSRASRLSKRKLDSSSSPSPPSSSPFSPSPPSSSSPASPCPCSLLGSPSSSPRCSPSSSPLCSPSYSRASQGLLQRGEAAALARLLVLVLALGGAFCLARHVSFLQLFKDFLTDPSRPRGEGEGGRAALAHADPGSAQVARAGLFVLLYAVGGVLFVPAPIMSVAAGALFPDNFLLPVCLILVGSLSGACLSFLFARFLLRSLVVRFVVAKRPILRAVDFAIRKEGIKVLLCARMVLPYTLNNYFLGVTGVSLWEFALATFLTGVPFAVAYAAIGAELRDLDSIFLGASVSPSSPDSPALSVSSFLASKLSGGGLKSVMVVAACALLFAGVHTVKNIAREVLSQAAEDLDARESEKLLNREDEEKLKRGE
ncbi:SNARE associated Golgi protein [Toxoplasma gondii ME49]|uniref:SNARE associated Golgi protein n=3 Tax=Toxoplasma gondii TaxID=5811 RepID=A0A125YQT4_TOXGV|nr:SNARE associated Golgi protein [Toxoplasma gondii ME49]EPT25053.1 SNARE associated Golgi protein [Toxoplasma gondii ME49]ESS34375.1 SNARE associated Golgi protein [Toxoplasma gondii VEG]CEL78510.1 TPA: SNARE associated Golgi protein, putative [Toxoplasma gondii VEG]|eukprot:XP_018635018.1 SNARE associated Golgi protein [Toxoplasma gondii ME49]